MNMLEGLLSSFSLGFLVNLYDDIDDNIFLKKMFSDVFMELLKILMIYLLLSSPLNHPLILLICTVMLLACWAADRLLSTKIDKDSIDDSSFCKAVCIFLIPFVAYRLYYSGYKLQDLFYHPMFMIILLLWVGSVWWEQLYFPGESSNNKFYCRILFTLSILSYVVSYFCLNSYINYIFDYVNLNADLFLYFCYCCLGYFVSWLLIRIIFKESFSNNEGFDEDQKSKVERKEKSKVERKEKSKVERKEKSKVERKEKSKAERKEKSKLREKKM